MSEVGEKANIQCIKYKTQSGERKPANVTDDMPQKVISMLAQNLKAFFKPSLLKGFLPPLTICCKT